MGDALTPGKKMQILSVPFNFLTVINDSSYSLDITSMHNTIMNPLIIIRNPVKKGDKETEESLKNLEGQTAEAEN